MSRTVFSTSNPNRKEKFLIRTDVIDALDNTRVVKKLPLGKDSETHLKKMFEYYLEFNGTLEKDFKLCPVKKTDEGLIFDFILGTSAERALLDAVLGNDEVLVRTIVDKLFGFVDSLPAKNINKKEGEKFIKLFGNSFLEQTGVYPGLIDLNLDNFIINNKKWTLIDYEWVIDIPVPTRLLKTRILYYFCHRHQEAFEYYSSKIDCGLSNDNLLIPSVFKVNYAKYISNFSKIIESERVFQEYVSRYPVSHEKRQLPPDVPGIGWLLDDKHGLLYKLEKELDKIRTDLKKADLENDSLKRQLAVIYSSKSYKLARMPSKIRRIINGR